MEGVLKRERALLKREEAPNRETLSDYLGAYFAHREMIAEHLLQEQGREFDGSNAGETAIEGDVEELSAEEELTPLSDGNSP